MGQMKKNPPKPGPGNQRAQNSSVQSNIDHVKSAPVSDKPMSMDEKTNLKNNIG